jgi:hypothetical protein
MVTNKRAATRAKCTEAFMAFSKLGYKPWFTLIPGLTLGK